MTEATLKDVFSKVVSETAERLRPNGFVRRGMVLRRVEGDTCAVLEFQRSTKSSADRILFTVNLGVVHGDLLPPDSSGLAKSRIIDAHLRLRIGVLLPGSPDKWWEIDASTNAEALANEVADIVKETGVPYILDFLSTDAILELWESGQSPGLTDGERKELLDSLKSKRKGGAA